MLAGGTLRWLRERRFVGKCNECKTNEGDISAIIAGEYYTNLCADCRAHLNAGQSISSGHARWSRSIDLEDMEYAIQQPRNADGTPNRRFVQLYPEQARAVLTEQEMRKAE